MNIEEYSKYIDNIKDMNKEELQDYILQYFETLKTHHNIEDELQDRIDKAVEYIKDDMYVEPNELYGLVDGEKVLNILQGSDKE
jgi:hypothetical protein